MEIIYKGYIHKSVSKGSGRGKSGLMHEICQPRTFFYEDIHLYVLTGSNYEKKIGCISASGKLRSKIENNKLTSLDEEEVLGIMGKVSDEDVLVHRQDINSWFYVDLSLLDLKERIKTIESVDEIDGVLWQKRQKPSKKV